MTSGVTGDSGVGCCTDCQGTGTTADPDTGGLCWDCQGTGHPHDPQTACCRDCAAAAQGPEPCTACAAGNHVEIDKAPDTCSCSVCDCIAEWPAALKGGLG